MKIVSQALIESGNVDKAIEIAISISDEDFRLSALEHIYQVLLKKENIDKVIKLVDVIWEKFPNMFFTSIHENSIGFLRN